ncbi:Uu.00g064680.m01.CDS01 [Anthostomella pinea]|uniref:Uu.00g064680.m01.CDS01 n=1 Tax=Anthostomella pinea TaxID=933095 RepID=A0AAI8VUU4_9PEZI|nr:Uu.00g064680.m01.CDS01 [Anthostomella pinea]
MHALAQQIKNGAVLPRQYNTVIYVGHSQGSLIGKAYIDQHPSDVSAVMLTGWTASEPLSAVSAELILPGLATAASVHQRFHDLAPGYLTGVNASARAPFYSNQGKDYNPAILTYDFATEDVVTIGTLFTETSLNQTIKSGFIGPVFVLTGQLDRIFCGSSGNCQGANGSVLAQQAQYFPSASNYSYFSPANTGHDWNLHYTQDVSFGRAFDWLADVGFGPSGH